MSAPQLRHYPQDKLRTLCGRPITIMMKVTRDAARVTCGICKDKENSDEG